MGPKKEQKQTPKQREEVVVNIKWVESNSESLIAEKYIDKD